MNKIKSNPEVAEFQKLSRKYSDTSIFMHEAIARKAGLSGTDHKYLGLLIEKGEMTAGELSKVTGLTTGAITGLTDRLEKRKLVKRAYPDGDRRKVIIVPNTQNAMKLLEPDFNELSKKTTALILTFNEKELEIMKRYFQSAIEIMEEFKNNINKNNKTK